MVTCMEVLLGVAIIALFVGVIIGGFLLIGLFPEYVIGAGVIAALIAVVFDLF